MWKLQVREVGSSWLDAAEADSVEKLLKVFDWALNTPFQVMTVRPLEARILRPDGAVEERASWKPTPVDDRSDD